ncbi:uncharacterized protein ColSpa_01317 [Colletotrichum spaethianum]|uniref:Uncharacterized protein n=1 Tax=Colletotrichum spaethianum TaxID=700344 RepID=A0AA37P4G4_9PEZI|nr:uncharacterized protein ColSpa_01317 [Colletotrichum spaethianum]GKT41136.1 hypothetical protein ColSpa_01317 [Colletotrichum spaethianum]
MPLILITEPPSESQVSCAVAVVVVVPPGLHGHTHHNLRALGVRASVGHVSKFVDGTVASVVPAAGITTPLPPKALDSLLQERSSHSIILTLSRSSYSLREIFAGEVSLELAALASWYTASDGARRYLGLMALSAAAMTSGSYHLSSVRMA